VNQPSKTEVLKATLNKLHREADEASAKSLRSFLDYVVADVAPKPQRYGLVEEKWQRERNDRIIPAAMYIAGFNPQYDGPLFFYEGFHKGCDKSGTIARVAGWMLGYAKRQLRMCAAAKDREQAEVVYDSMKRTAELNPWLDKRLEFKRNQVLSKINGSRLDVLTSDAGGVAGPTPDVIIADELSQWADERFWDGLFGGAMKRSGIDPTTKKPKSYNLTYVITNAGFKDTWQWRLRNTAKENLDGLWSFYENPEYTILPQWLTPAVINGVRRSMSAQEAKRLIDNVWLDLSEASERYFTSEDIDAAIGVPASPPPGATVYLGCDYGEKKDRTALAVVWMDDNGTVHVPDMTVYQGTVESPVQLEDIEHWIDLQLGRYPNAVPVIDPYQMLWLLQKYEKNGQPFRKFEFRGGKSNLLMGDNLRNLFRNRKIVFSPYTGLIGGSTLADEFKQIICQEKAYGTRMQHTRKSADDRVVAVGMAALCAVMETEPGPVPQKTDPHAEHERHIRTRPSSSTPDLNRTHAARIGLFGLQMPHN
jgi:hypothetical protein